MANITKTIGTTGRDYTTIALWEADLDLGSIYAAEDNAIGEMYDDSDFTAGATINGGGSIGLTSVKLTVASGQRFLGVLNGGVRVLGAVGLTVSRTNTTVEYLEWNLNNGNIQIPFHLGASNAGNVVRYCAIHNLLRSGDIHVIRIQNNVQVHNNWIFNIRNSFGGFIVLAGIARVTGGTPGIYNNTIHDLDSTNSVASGGNVNGFLVAAGTVKNNIATDCDKISASVTDADFNITGTTENNNAASDTSISGTGDLQSLSSVNQYVSNASPYDLSVKNSSANIVDAGVDLVTTPTGVNIDIKGRDRDVQNDTWDIGAHEGFNAGVVIEDLSFTIISVGDLIEFHSPQKESLDFLIFSSDEVTDTLISSGLFTETLDFTIVSVGTIEDFQTYQESVNFTIVSSGTLIELFNPVETLDFIIISSATVSETFIAVLGSESLEFTIISLGQLVEKYSPQKETLDDTFITTGSLIEFQLSNALSLFIDAEGQLEVIESFLGFVEMEPSGVTWTEMAPAAQGWTEQAPGSQIWKEQPFHE